MSEYAKVQSGLVKEIVGIACASRFFAIVFWVNDLPAIATYTPVLEAWNHNLAHLDVILRYSTRFALIQPSSSSNPSIPFIQPCACGCERARAICETLHAREGVRQLDPSGRPPSLS